MPDKAKVQETKVEEVAAPAAAPVAEVVKLPASLSLVASGKRERLTIREVSANILTEDVKLDRDAVFQVGRLLEEPDLFTVLEGDATIATFTRNDKEWTISYADGTTEQHARSETKRPKRKDGADPGLDPGPDAFMVVNHACKKIWPALNATGGGAGSATVKALRKENEAAAQQIAQLRAVLETLAKMAGVDLSTLMPAEAPQEDAADDEVEDENDQGE